MNRRIFGELYIFSKVLFVFGLEIKMKIVDIFFLILVKDKFYVREAVR